ncbi:GDSL-type esterase/lipase family protein [Paenibacillus caui]|uniref:GDSL-type esterase/lipase family protein n=1 Tax=Paenibacillus caui TaxID=2873927 RepID=UPI001CA7D824|nr:GDSL-type esterase/lipase family protein [Paenibacillus caui]
MRSSSRVWRIVSFLSFVTTLLLLCGFIYAVKDITYPSASSGMELVPSTDQKDQPAVSPGQTGIVVIGDSLAKGTGDDEGLGFAMRTVQLLQEKDKNQEVRLFGNLGINGLTTDSLSEELKEKGVQYMLKEANVILLSIGGNDLFNGGQALENGDDLPTAKELNASIDAASVKLKSVAKQIVAINPDATLVYIGLYNPFSDLQEMRSIGNTAAARWNMLALETFNPYRNALVVPTYDLFAGNVSKYLSGDHFHPNGEGYQQIAERIVQSLN